MGETEAETFAVEVDLAASSLRSQTSMVAVCGEGLGLGLAQYDEEAKLVGRAAVGKGGAN